MPNMIIDENMLDEIGSIREELAYTHELRLVVDGSSGYMYGIGGAGYAAARAYNFLAKLTSEEIAPDSTDSANSTDWVLANDRLPLPDQAGAFGVVEVIKQCAGKDWQSVAYARPIAIGGNRDRIIWVDPDTNNPVENSSWFVTHWRPFPVFPKPIT